MCTNEDHEEIVSCIENLWDQLQRQCRTWVWKVSKCPVLLTKSGSRYQQEACEGGVFITSQLTLECDVDISIFITNLIRMLQYAVKIQQTHMLEAATRKCFSFLLEKRPNWSIIQTVAYEFSVYQSTGLTLISLWNCCSLCDLQVRYPVLQKEGKSFWEWMSRNRDEWCSSWNVINILG